VSGLDVITTASVQTKKLAISCHSVSISNSVWVGLKHRWCHLHSVSSDVTRNVNQRNVLGKGKGQVVPRTRHEGI